MGRPQEIVVSIISCPQFRWGTAYDQPARTSHGCDDGDQAAKIIKDALGIESDDILNYTFPKDWPTDREVRARIIRDWLQSEARYLA